MGCGATVNRSFGTLGDRLFKVNYEGTLVALDTRTGTGLWEMKLADFHNGYTPPSRL